MKVKYLFLSYIVGMIISTTLLIGCGLVDALADDPLCNQLRMKFLSSNSCAEFCAPDCNWTKVGEDCQCTYK